MKDLNATHDGRTCRVVLKSCKTHWIPPGHKVSLAQLQILALHMSDKSTRWKHVNKIEQIFYPFLILPRLWVVAPLQVEDEHNLKSPPRMAHRCALRVPALCEALGWSFQLPKTKWTKETLAFVCFVCFVATYCTVWRCTKAGHSCTDFWQMVAGFWWTQLLKQLVLMYLSHY